MPIQFHNRGRQRSTKFEVCTNALLTMRGQQLRHLRLGTDSEAEANIAAIDHVLIKVIGYDGDIIEQSRDFRRVTTFKRGELTKAIMDTLRAAERPLTTLEMAQAVMATKGVSVSYSRKDKPRVSNVYEGLRRLHGLGRVVRGADASGNVVWSRVG